MAVNPLLYIFSSILLREKSITGLKILLDKSFLTINQNDSDTISSQGTLRTQVNND